MISTFKQKIEDRLQIWYKSRAPTTSVQKFGLNNLYIFPSSFGWFYALITLAIALGAINYQLNPAFLLFFLLIIMGVIALWETHNNLRGLEITCLQISDTELGHSVKVTLLLHSDISARYSIYFQFTDEEDVWVERITTSQGQVIVPIKTKQRGKFKLPPLKIYSSYPLGIFRAWGYAYFPQEFYVYPKAISPGFWPDAHVVEKKITKGSEKKGEEELYDLQQVANPWTQPGRIAWKISARGQGWYLKTLSSPMGENWLFSLNDLPKGAIEANLQHLSYWLQTAEAKGFLYGLEIKGARTSITKGSEHLKDCLRRLALY